MSRPDLREVLAAEREVMNELAPSYHDNVRSNSYVYRSLRRGFVSWLLQTLRDAGRAPESLRYLDLGCGPGDLLTGLADAGCRRLTGIDLAEVMLQRARRACEPAPALVRGCIEAPPLAAASHDVVVAGFTLHHLAEPRALFALVDRVLRRGGWFFLLEYDRRHLEGLARKAGVETWAAPARRALRLKNRAFLRRFAGAPVRFNPAHRLRSFDEIRAAMPRPEAYELSRQACGLTASAFANVVDADSRFDRALVHGLEALDRRLGPRLGGGFQWIAGRRRDPPAGDPG